MLAAANLFKQKLIAVILGPAGLGLFGLYNSILTTASTVAQCGSSQSAVREIASRNSKNDSSGVAEIAIDIRRLSLGLGILGLVGTCLFAKQLAVLTFGDDNNQRSICLLGVGVALTVMVGSGTARLQGLSEIRRLVVSQMLGAVVGAAIGVTILVILGERGIVPAIVMSCAIQLISVETICLSLGIRSGHRPWRVTLCNAKKILSLGGAFMYGAVLASGTLVFIRSFIIRNMGEESAGIFYAAYSLSAMVGGFVISAMSADFYPRLVGVSTDNIRVKKLVNEQIEVGCLLAGPALMIALVFPRELMVLLFSDAFAQGAELLQVFSLGVYCMVIMFPVGMIQRAKAASFWMYFGQSEANILHILLVLLWGYDLGLSGIGNAFLVHIIVHLFVVFYIGWAISQYRIRPSTLLLGLMPILLYFCFKAWCSAIGDSYLARFGVVLATLLVSFGGIYRKRTNAPL